MSRQEQDEADRQSDWDERNCEDEWHKDPDNDDD